MTAHKQQDQRVVWIYVSLNIDRRRGFQFIYHGGFPLAAGKFTPNLVGHSPTGDLNQPAAWIIWDAPLRPLREGRNHGLLHCILGGGKVAKTASNRTEHL